MAAHSPLLSLAETCPEVANQILGFLSLRALAALSATCRGLRLATRQQPEHEWLARAQRYPARHPLLQAPCIRAFLDQQRSLFAEFGRSRIEETPIAGHLCSVSLASTYAKPCCLLHAPAVCGTHLLCSGTEAALLPAAHVLYGCTLSWQVRGAEAVHTPRRCPQISAG